jgi:hypothetical protein
MPKSHQSFVGHLQAHIFLDSDAACAKVEYCTFWRAALPRSSVSQNDVAYKILSLLLDFIDQFTNTVSDDR